MLKVLAPVVVIVLAWAAPAFGADVSASYETETRYGQRDGEPYEVTLATIAVDAAPGARDEVSIGLAGGDVRVIDSAGARAGAGCRQATPTEVLCDDKDFARVKVALGDLDDTATVTGIVGTVDGGPGDDALQTAGAHALGGPGADTLSSGTLMDGGTGPDVLRGAGVASYDGRAAPVRVTLDGGADDGEAGEGDDVGPVSAVIGGAGGDTIAGTAGKDDLRGGGGDDAIDGGGGSDELTGGDGADRLAGGDGDDVITGASRFEDIEDGDANAIDGGAGDDRLIGSSGPDIIDGGPGTDEIGGREGGDTLRSRDATRDLLHCARHDKRRSGTAEVDARDLVRGCAAVDRSGPARAQALQAGARELDALFGVVLGCPQDMPAGCTVRLRVGTRRVTAGRATRRIAAGERRGIGVRLSRRALRRIPAYRPPRGTPRFCGYRRLTLTLTSRSSAGTVVQERHVVRFGSSGLACGFGYVDEFFAGWSDL